MASTSNSLEGQAMTPTIDQKMRVVAEKLGMLKPQLCDRYQQAQVGTTARICTSCGAETNEPLVELPQYVPHDIPPPNFLEPAGADALMTALLVEHQKYGIDFYRNGRGTHIIHINDIRGEGSTWREALLDAAFKLLGD